MTGTVRAGRAAGCVLAALSLLTAGCAPVVHLQSDPAELQQARSELTPATPVAGRAEFRLAQGVSTTASAQDDAAVRALATANAMLVQAGPTMVQRWFAGGAQAPRFTVVGQVTELHYHSRSKLGVSEPTFSISVALNVLSANGMQVLRGVYRSGKVTGTRHVALLRGRGSYQDEFDRTAYRALLKALDRGMKDLSTRLHLPPASADPSR